MSESEATLKSLFSLEVSDLPPLIAAALESADGSAAMKGQILQKAAKIDWDTIFTEIVEKVSGLLDMNMADIMMAAWSKYELLAQYRDEAKYPPGESALVPLAKHSLSSEHKPSVEVLVNDQSLAELAFSIKLTLHLDGAVLKIQDKKIREIRLGKVGGEGSIKCGDFQIAKKAFDSATLPGSIALDPGLEIPEVVGPQG